MPTQRARVPDRQKSTLEEFPSLAKFSFRFDNFRPGVRKKLAVLHRINSDHADFTTFIILRDRLESPCVNMRVFTGGEQRPHADA